MDSTRQSGCRTATPAIARRYRRRSLGYVYFLGTTMLVAVIGVSALIVARIQLRAAAGASDCTAARLNAQSAIEFGLAVIHAYPDWRDNPGPGTWLSEEPIGAGTFGLKVVVIEDGDGNPKNDAVVLTGTGAQGEAAHTMEITLVSLSDRGGYVMSPGSGHRTSG